jgi:hypothetical protein
MSGRKQSGKNTSVNIIAGTILNDVGFATKVNGKNGDLMVVDDNGKWTKLDLSCRIGEYYDWLNKEVHPFVKIYSFADPLKEFCINVLGLTREQCYGTNEQKNSKTHLKWKDFKKFLPPKHKQELTNKNLWRSQMTGREVMQVFGTDVVREIYEDAWVTGTITQIKSEKSGCALIPDVRFPNEVLGLQDIGGKVLRLTRNPCPGDEHVSELALDNFKDFDAFLNNDSDTIEEQAVKISEFLQGIKNEQTP